MIIGRRARMVEKYVSGRMSPEERQDFLRKLDRDAGLRTLLAQEQALEEAMLRDKAAVPILEADFPERLYRKLEQHPAPNREGQDTNGSHKGSGATFYGSTGALLWLLFASVLVVAVAGLFPLVFNEPKTPSPLMSSNRVENRDRESIRQQYGATGIQPGFSLSTDSSASSSSEAFGTDSARRLGRSGEGVASQSSPRNPAKDNSGNPDDAVRDYLDREEHTGGVKVIKSDSTTRMKFEMTDTDKNKKR